jgi:hypothetical protein
VSLLRFRATSAFAIVSSNFFELFCITISLGKFNPFTAASIVISFKSSTYTALLALLFISAYILVKYDVAEAKAEMKMNFSHTVFYSINEVTFY